MRIELAVKISTEDEDGNDTAMLGYTIQVLANNSYEVERLNPHEAIVTCENFWQLSSVAGIVMGCARTWHETHPELVGQKPERPQLTGESIPEAPVQD